MANLPLASSGARRAGARDRLRHGDQLRLHGIRGGSRRRGSSSSPACRPSSSISTPRPRACSRRRERGGRGRWTTLPRPHRREVRRRGHRSRPRPRKRPARVSFIARVLRRDPSTSRVGRDVQAWIPGGRRVSSPSSPSPSVRSSRTARVASVGVGGSISWPAGNRSSADGAVSGRTHARGRARRPVASGPHRLPVEQIDAVLRHERVVDWPAPSRRAHPLHRNRPVNEYLLLRRLLRWPSRGRPAAGCRPRAMW